MKWYVIAHFWWFPFGQIEPTMRIEHYGPYNSSLACEHKIDTLEDTGMLFISLPFCINLPEPD